VGLAKKMMQAHTEYICDCGLLEDLTAIAADILDIITDLASREVVPANVCNKRQVTLNLPPKANPHSPSPIKHKSGITAALEIS